MSSDRSIDLTNTTCVILAGGQGKRMASPNTHKVCFPIGGTPAIVRAIDAHKQAGIERFLVVVGQLAEQVMSTVSDTHPDIEFAHQAEQRGTGHAALVGVEALAARGLHDAVIVAMGDSLVEPRVVRKLLRSFDDGSYDAAVTTVPKTPNTTSGRVVRDGRTVVGVVEVPDIQLARRDKRTLIVGGKRYDPVELEAEADSVNVSLYAFGLESLREALAQIGSDNAQSEMYLTDTIEYLARHGRVHELLVKEPNAVMSFNTVEELRAIEEVIADRH